MRFGEYQTDMVRSMSFVGIAMLALFVVGLTAVAGAQIEREQRIAMEEVEEPDGGDGGEQARRIVVEVPIEVVPIEVDSDPDPAQPDDSGAEDSDAGSFNGQASPPQPQVVFASPPPQVIREPQVVVRPRATEVRVVQTPAPQQSSPPTTREPRDRSLIRACLLDVCVP